MGLVVQCLVAVVGFGGCGGGLKSFSFQMFFSGFRNLPNCYIC